jgi:hypothetical protein
MAKTNTKTVKIQYNDVALHVANDTIVAFWYVENGKTKHAFYPTNGIVEARTTMNGGLMLTVVEGCNPVITDCDEVIQSVPSTGSYFVMKPANQSNVTYYGILGEDYDGESDTIKNNIIQFKVEDDKVVELLFNDDLILEDDDMFRAPTENEQEFITSTLKSQGYYFNEGTCKIERLN